MQNLTKPLLPKLFVDSVVQMVQKEEAPKGNIFSSALSKVRSGVTIISDSKKTYKGNRWFKEIIEQVKKYIIDKVEYSIKLSFKINSMILTQNKRYLILGVNTGSIATFDTKKRIIISEVKLPQNTIFRLLLTADEKYLITCGDGNDVFVYEYSGYKLVATLSGHTDNVMRIVQTADSKWLYSASHDGEIRRWNLKNFTGGEVIAQHTGMCKALAINGTGSQVFSAGDDMVIKVIDTTKAETQDLIGHEDCVWAIEVAPHGLNVASASDDMTVRVWNIQRMECIKIFYGHTARANVLKFTSDSQHIISGSSDSTVRIWSMELGKSPIVMKGHSGGIRALLINPVNNQIFTTGEDKLLKICSLPDNGDTDYLTTHSCPIISTHSSSTMKYIISTDTKGYIKIWNWIRNSFSKNLACINKLITSSHLTKDDKYLILGTEDGSILLINLFTEKTTSFKGHDAAIRAIALNDSMDIMMTDSSDFKIAVWDFPNVQLKYFMRGHTNYVTKIVIRSDTEAISGGSDKLIKIWNLERKKAVLTLLRHDSEVSALTMSASKEFLFSGDANGTVNVWNLKGRQHESSFVVHRSCVCNLHVTKDDQYLISADLSGRVAFWDISSRQRISYISLGNINTLSIDAFDNYLITGQGRALIIHKNPLKASSLSIYGPSESKGKLFNYLSRILIQKKDPEYDRKHDDWIIMPYRINVLHIYAYLGLAEHVKAALKNRFNMIPSMQNDTILTLCINCGDNKGTQIITEKLCDEVENNPFILAAIEDKLVLLNQKGNICLPKLYDCFIKVNTDEALPKSCDEDHEFPIVKLSDSRVIDPVSFLATALDTNEGNFVVFKQSLIRVNCTSGSSRSITFLESLAECPNEDIFRSDYVQTLLDLKWKNCRYYMYIQAVIFLVYTILLCYHTITQSYNWVLMVSLLSINFTLLCFEFVKMRINGLEYWHHALNYLDLVRSASCIAYLLFFLLEVTSEWNYQLFTVVTLTTWVRGVVYFRIFKSTRYLSRLLTEVVLDFQSFLFILAYSTLSQCFITMVMEHKFGGESFEENIFTAYKLNLGDVGSVYSDNFSYFKFVIATIVIIINPIIMLNLLISIIGDSFERVQSTRVVADMKELCQMVIEVERLLFWRRKLDEKKYIQICNLKEKEELPNEAWEGLIIELDKKMTYVKENIVKNQERNEDKLNDILKYLTSSDPDMQKQYENRQNVLKIMSSKLAERAG